MAAAPEELDLSVLIMAAKDASNMLAIEERLRYSLKNAVSKEMLQSLENIYVVLIKEQVCVCCDLCVFYRDYYLK